MPKGAPWASLAVSTAVLWLVMVAVVVVAFTPLEAGAGWGMAASNGSNVVFARTADDTSGAVTAIAFRQAGSPTTAQYAAGSFCATAPSNAFFYAVRANGTTCSIPADCQSLTYPLIASYSYLFVFPATGQKWYVGSSQPLPVNLWNTAGTSQLATLPVTLGGVPVGVSSMPSVSLGASVSVDGTLPVTVVPFDGPGLMVLALGVCFFGGSLAFDHMRVPYGVG